MQCHTTVQCKHFEGCKIEVYSYGRISYGIKVNWGNTTPGLFHFLYKPMEKKGKMAASNGIALPIMLFL